MKKYATTISIVIPINVCVTDVGDIIDNRLDHWCYSGDDLGTKDKRWKWTWVLRLGGPHMGEV